jgi:hypothetical protein
MQPYSCLIILDFFNLKTCCSLIPDAVELLQVIYKTAPCRGPTQPETNFSEHDRITRDHVIITALLTVRRVSGLTKARQNRDVCRWLQLAHFLPQRSGQVSWTEIEISLGRKNGAAEVN